MKSTSLCSGQQENCNVEETREVGMSVQQVWVCVTLVKVVSDLFHLYIIEYLN